MRDISPIDAWHDYTKNFFSPKAPILYMMYRKQRNFSIPMAITFMIIWSFIYFVTINRNTTEQAEIYNSWKLGISFWLMVSIIYVTTMMPELRMYHKRGKSLAFYISLIILLVVGGGLYCLAMVLLNIRIEVMIILILTWPLLFSSSDSYVKKIEKEEPRKYYKT